jgi:hypothetical protein
MRFVGFTRSVLSLHLSLRRCGGSEIKMKSIVLACAALFCATAANADEVWTCSYEPLSSQSVTAEPKFLRFRLSPDGLIETTHGDHYRIVENNDYGLIATLPIATIKPGQNVPTVGAATVAINWGTQEFWLAKGSPGQLDPDIHPPVHGKCLKD